jgi:hypothetical protein
MSDMKNPPPSLDARTLTAIARALAREKKHPTLYRFEPVLDVGLGVALALYTSVHLTSTFIVYLRSVLNLP